MSKLLKSRQFLLLLLDTIVSLVMFGITQYAPVAREFAGQLWVILQPAFVALIVGITVEEFARNKYGVVFAEQWSALKALFKSRKFLLLLLDTIVAVIVLVVSTYYPLNLENANALIGYLQPLIVAIIVGISVEDFASYANGKIKATRPR